jgi:hypothetical protein
MRLTQGTGRRSTRPPTPLASCLRANGREGAGRATVVRRGEKMACLPSRAEVLKYWSTNPELRVDIDISQRAVPAPNPPGGQTTVLDELRVRLYDNRHLLSLPFDERSTGFRWFFSFLAAFSNYLYSNEPVILLLDEPGRNPACEKEGGSLITMPPLGVNLRLQ